MIKKAKFKQYPVKMDFPLWDKLVNRAEDDKRSVNQTIIIAIERLLEDAPASHKLGYTPDQL
jgi:hypothetical protein